MDWDWEDVAKNWCDVGIFTKTNNETSEQRPVFRFAVAKLH